MKALTKPILAAFDKLPSNERQAIVTVYQCSYREAAIALGESERTVRLRILAGLRRLAALTETSDSPTVTAGDGS